MQICVSGGYVSMLDPAALRLLHLADLHIQPPILPSVRTTCSLSQHKSCGVSLWEIWSKLGALMLLETPLDSLEGREPLGESTIHKSGMSRRVCYCVTHLHI